VRANAAGLATALDAANSRIATDSSSAAALRTRLARAKTQLAALEKMLARCSPPGHW
jgi:hypothetical protein